MSKNPVLSCPSPNRQRVGLEKVRGEMKIVIEIVNDKKLGQKISYEFQIGTSKRAGSQPLNEDSFVLFCEMLRCARNLGRIFGDKD